MRDSYTSMGVYLGPDARFDCFAYPDSGPILTVEAGRTCLSLHANEHKIVAAGDVANARRLLEVVQTYVAECERVHAQQTARQTKRQTEPGKSGNTAVNVDAADPVRGAAA